MINLLSPDLQSELRAAHLNVRLRSYIFIFLVVLVAIVLVFAAGLLLSYQQRVTAESVIDDNNQAIEKYSDVRQKAESFHNNLQIAKSILSQEILYSDMIVDVTKILPTDTMLTRLAVNEESITKPVSLEARVKSPQAAVVLKNTLEQSAIFSDVSLISVQEITINEQSDTTNLYPNHPYIVNIQVSFEKDWLSGDRS